MQNPIKTFLTSIRRCIRTAPPRSRARRNMVVATKDSWHREPMPEKHGILDFPDEYTQNMFAEISKGLIPEIMEDRWFMYVEDNTLYIHRSWTGFCIFTVDFVKESDKYKVKKAVVNRDSEQYYASSDEEEVQTLRSLINNKFTI